MRAALVSLDQRWHDKEANFARCSACADEAAEGGCGLLIFPEMTLTGYSIDIPAIVEPEIGSVTLKRFGILARETELTIAFGACLTEPRTGRPRNCLCLARPDGSSMAIYSKIHPFSLAGEDKVLESGSALAVATVGELTIGMSICYDLRFPEMYAAMVPACNVAVVIANWPTNRVAHWRTLLVARAIENQLAVLGVNRVGIDRSGLSYERSTMAVAADGTVLKPLRSVEEMDIYEVDVRETELYRQEFPTLRDKRASLYPHLRIATDVA